jgi:DNA-binding CsgD family transcriptional regulator
MRKTISKVPAFRTFAGIAASSAIVRLLFEEGFDTFGPMTLAYALVAALSLANALIPSRAARGPLARLRPSRGETLRLESFRITPRERELVQEFLSGKSMKEISLEQHISYSTVRNVFSSVYEKLGLSGSTELVALGAYYTIE